MDVKRVMPYIGRDGDARMRTADGGDYVRYADHLAALAENDRMIAYLEAALQTEQTIHDGCDESLAAAQQESARLREALGKPVSDNEAALFAHYMKQDEIPCLSIRLGDVGKLLAARLAALSGDAAPRQAEGGKG